MRFIGERVRRGAVRRAVQIDCYEGLYRGQISGISRSKAIGGLVNRSALFLFPPRESVDPRVAATSRFAPGVNTGVCARTHLRT